MAGETVTTAQEIAQQTWNFLDAMRSKANQEIDRLDTFADTWDYLDLTAHALGNISNTTAIMSNSGFDVTTDAPVKTDLTLDDLSYSAIGTLSALNGYTAWTSVPSLIPAPTFADAKTPMWGVDSTWTSLKTGIDAFINNITGSDDIDSVLTKLTNDTTKYQVAFYAQDLERKQQVLRDLYSAANSSTGNKGFLFPNSMTTALKLDAQQKYQFDLSQTSRDLIKFLYEWAKNNWQFSVDKGINAHNSDIDFNIRYCDVLLKAYSEEINAQLTKFKESVTLDLAKAKTAVEEFSAKVDGLIKSYTVDTQSKLDTIKISLERDKVMLSALTETDKMKLEGWIAWVTNELQVTDLNIKAQQASRKNQIDAATQALQGATTVASSASQIALGVL